MSLRVMLDIRPVSHPPLRAIPLELSAAGQLPGGSNPVRQQFLRLNCSIYRNSSLDITRSQAKRNCSLWNRPLSLSQTMLRNTRVAQTNRQACYGIIAIWSGLSFHGQLHQPVESPATGTLCLGQHSKFGTRFMNESAGNV